jgi:TctA family transporter
VRSNAVEELQENAMSKRYILLTILTAAVMGTQIGCAPLAAGVVGAAVGHEVAQKRDEDDGDKD